MAINVARGCSDETIEQIVAALRPYEAEHPQASVDLYRQSPASIRVRIIDPAFADMNRVERNDAVWRYFDALSEDAQSDISMLVLVTPGEMARSIANVEFENPVPAVFP